MAPIRVERLDEPCHDTRRENPGPLVLVGAVRVGVDRLGEELVTGDVAHGHGDGLVREDRLRLVLEAVDHVLPEDGTIHTSAIRWTTIKDALASTATLFSQFPAAVSDNPHT